MEVNCESASVNEKCHTTCFSLPQAARSLASTLSTVPAHMVHWLEVPPELGLGGQSDAKISKKLRVERRVFSSVQEVHAGALPCEPSLLPLFVTLHCRSHCQAVEVWGSHKCHWWYEYPLLRKTNLEIILTCVGSLSKRTQSKRRPWVREDLIWCPCNICFICKQSLVKQWKVAISKPTNAVSASPNNYVDFYHVPSSFQSRYFKGVCFTAFCIKNYP